MRWQTFGPRWKRASRCWSRPRPVLPCRISLAQRVAAAPAALPGRLPVYPHWAATIGQPPERPLPPELQPIIEHTISPPVDVAKDTRPTRSDRKRHRHSGTGIDGRNASKSRRSGDIAGRRDLTQSCQNATAGTDAMQKPSELLTWLTYPICASACDTDSSVFPTDPTIPTESSALKFEIVSV